MKIIMILFLCSSNFFSESLFCMMSDDQVNDQIKAQDKIDKKIKEIRHDLNKLKNDLNSASASIDYKSVSIELDRLIASLYCFQYKIETNNKLNKDFSESMIKEIKTLLSEIHPIITQIQDVKKQSQGNQDQPIPKKISQPVNTNQNIAINPPLTTEDKGYQLLDSNGKLVRNNVCFLLASGILKNDHDVTSFDKLFEDLTNAVLNDNKKVMDALWESYQTQKTAGEAFVKNTNLNNDKQGMLDYLEIMKNNSIQLDDSFIGAIGIIKNTRYGIYYKTPDNLASGGIGYESAGSDNATNLVQVSFDGTYNPENKMFTGGHFVSVTSPININKLVNGDTGNAIAKNVAETVLYSTGEDIKNQIKQELTSRPDIAKAKILSLVSDIYNLLPQDKKVILESPIKMVNNSNQGGYGSKDNAIAEIINWIKRILG